jgi:serine/threonine-protein kinase
LLGGKKPFEGDTPKEILQAQLDRETTFVPPRALNPDIPLALEKSILRCLERDPAKRYPDLSMLVHELKTTLYVK